MTFSCQIYDTTILLTQTSSLALSISGQVCHPTLLSSVGILMTPCPEPVLSIQRLSPGSGLCLSRPSGAYSHSIPRRAMQENYHLRLRVPLRIIRSIPGTGYHKRFAPAAETGVCNTRHDCASYHESGLGLDNAARQTFCNVPLYQVHKPSIQRVPLLSTLSGLPSS